MVRTSTGRYTSWTTESTQAPRFCQDIPYRFFSQDVKKTTLETAQSFWSTFTTYPLTPSRPRSMLHMLTGCRTATRCSMRRDTMTSVPPRTFVEHGEMEHQSSYSPRHGKRLTTFCYNYNNGRSTTWVARQMLAPHRKQGLLHRRRQKWHLHVRITIRNPGLTRTQSRTTWF